MVSRVKNEIAIAKLGVQKKEKNLAQILFYPTFVIRLTRGWSPAIFQINKSHFLLIIPLRHISMELRTYPSIFMHGSGWRIVWSIVKFYFSIEVQLYHFQIWFVVEM